MLTLNDGRSELWQWDTGRKLTVDADCSQVHFSNKVFGRSVDVDVVDGVAIIPDILLQTDKDLNAWAFVGTAENGYTKISKTFKVNQRNKPADYVFTPQEQTTLQEIEEKIKHLESIEFPVTSVNNKTGDVELNADDVGAISQEDLQYATDSALSQAKESGLFDGKPGKDGVDGHTPKYGVDYGTPEQIAGIAKQAAYIMKPDVSQIKDDLSDKLPKSPANWEQWTAEEQAVARDRIGIDNQFVRVFQQTNMNWNEETSLIVDVNDLSHLIICILIEGADSYVSEFGLVSLTEKNGDFYYGVFELGNATGPNITAFCRYDINDMPKMTKFSGTGGNPNFTIRGAYSKGIANESKNLPNYKVKKIHFPPMKGTISISVLGY